jgi:regulator of sirC expression with transglutaminase-like and TPR domain
MQGLERFAELVSLDEFDLAEASLLVAEDVYPEVNLEEALQQIDSMALTVRQRLAADAFPEQKVLALNHHLFQELGFVGNVDDYYDPRNSYLNEVLARRTGIPLTLSIVYLEVGRRLGLDLKGVSFPGHFLVKLALRRGQLVLDPFLGGEAQSAAALRERLASVLPADRSEAGLTSLALEPFLEAATHRQVIARLLRNLKHIYREAAQWDRALSVMHRMLLVLPESAEELRDRGIFYQQLECFRPALIDLQGYLRRREDAPDARDIRARIAELKAACARLN